MVRYGGTRVAAVDTVVIAHFNLRSTSELMAGGDAHWDLGQKDPEYGKKSYAPDFPKVDAACKALGGKLK